MVPISGYPLEPSYDTDLELDDNGYAYNGSCKVTNKCSQKDNGCLFINESSCYIADMDGREKYCQNQLVCILEKAENKATQFSKTSACWWADTTNNGDIFIYYTDLDLVIKECTNRMLKYDPKNTNGKTKVFVKDNETKIITDINGKIAKSLVSNFSYPSFLFGSSTPAKNAYKTIAQNVCYGYVCTDNNGNYKPMCPDGSCTDPCPTSDPENNNGNNGNSGGGDDNGADDSSSADTPKLNPPHSAKPYMNKLKTKYKISAK